MTSQYEDYIIYQTIAYSVLIKKMSWGLDLRDSEVYVLLNGRRARDINTGEEFGAVEFLDHGRTADELWVSNHKDTKSYFKVKFSVPSKFGRGVHGSHNLSLL